ncbi:MAG: hypothetical protein EA385_03915 [Salinarimonadaceae bacterium]|nr:MAG: hypothetical protein EA385_03915 [Salinarimonadaceae bacterium]
MNDALARITVIDLARELGRPKQTLFKVMRKLGIEPRRVKSPESNGQAVSVLSVEEAMRIRDHLDRSMSAADRYGNLNDIENMPPGFFYLAQLEPNFDPGRIKVGFAVNVEERVRQHRCSAPLLQVVAVWPCRFLWERTAIDCVTAGCERLHTEVFRAVSVDDVRKRCDAFFSLMPPP